MLDPESEQIREVYAFFGLAMYLAQNLERGLAIALAFFGDAKRVTAWDYDARLAENFESTFGALVTKFVQLAEPNHSKLADQLSRAVKDRNDLAHHYFWDRAVSLSSIDGRSQMIEELQGMAHRFESLDDELAKLTSACTERRGLSSKSLEALVASHMADLLGGIKQPYHPELVPNPVEIVGAYEWHVNGGLKRKLILESKDGKYLLLGEKGLCYGPRNIPAEQLFEKADLAKALPATVNPRPKKSTSWNFALTLANGFILRVRPDEVNGEQIIRFGLRKLKP